MVHIEAFRGWLYNSDKVDFSEVITPPNDVINAEQRKELLQHSHNFVQLILPEGADGKYAHAAALLTAWQGEEILVQDSEPNIYVYTQAYSIEHKSFTRLGFISLLKIEELGRGVLPHERILEKDLADRIALISTTKANLEIPFLLYDDKERKIDGILAAAIDGKEPYIDFTHEKVRHTLFKITDIKVIRHIQDAMKERQCIIADGHHRYTSALRVRDMLKEPNAQYGLMCFVNSFNEGMTILPSNRVVFDVNAPDFLKKLSPHFIVEEVPRHTLLSRMAAVDVMVDKSRNLKNHVFGVSTQEKSYLLTLKGNDALAKRLADKSEVFRKLDVTILHELVIKDILGITEEQQKKREHIDFVKGASETLQRLDEGAQIAFLLKPPLMREIFLTARAGETMPQKSTYFYPKVFSGLVIYDFGGRYYENKIVHTRAY